VYSGGAIDHTENTMTNFELDLGVAQRFTLRIIMVRLICEKTANECVAPRYERYASDRIHKMKG
jgi:hypothetical protein